MKNKKGRRGRKPAVYVEPDRLAKLPHDVLLNILERLNTADAIRTCILSKKMAKLPTMLSRFDLDASSFLPSNQKPDSLSLLARVNCALADATENALNFRCHQIDLRQLSVRFYLRHYECWSIGKAVAQAMATQKLDRAEFAILTEKEHIYCTPEDFLSFGKQFKSFFGAFPDVFAGLTRLQLENLLLDESDILSIFSTCKQLESLRLFNCRPSGHPVLRVKHPKLVELDVTRGTFDMVQLEYLPQLKRMVFNRWDAESDPLSFLHVPLLSSLSLTNDGLSWQMPLMLSQFLVDVTSITDLHLDFRSEKIWVQPESPQALAPVLHKLQLVNLVDIPEGCNISWTMFILEAAPSLKELCITVWDHWCNMYTDKKIRTKMGYSEQKDVQWESSASDFKHNNLAKLTIYGFQPDDTFLGYIRRVMEAAVNLEEISLYDRKVCPKCDYLDPQIKVRISPSRYPATEEERDLLRTQIIEGLEVASPDVIHFRS